MYLYICLDHLYSFPGLVSSVFILRGRKAYGPGLAQIPLQFLLRDILELAFVKGVFTDMGIHLDTGKEHQGNWGAMGGERSRWASFSWLFAPNTICLVGPL